MNKIKKIITTTFAFAFAVMLCAGAAACGKDENGAHGNIPQEEKYIVKPNGTSDYTVLKPKTADENVSFAVEELIYGIKETTGYEMSVSTEYKEGKKYLSVGETELYEKNKTEICGGDSLNKKTSRVVSVQDDIIMVGGNNEYTVYAVYDFMENVFGFKWYTFDDASVKKSDSISFTPLNITDKPDLNYRCLYSADYWLQDSLKRNRRMRVDGCNSEHFYTDEHNMIDKILPKDIYLEKHPEWYTKPVPGMDYETAGQLCLTNEEMTEEFIKRSKEIILSKWDNEECEYFTIGMQDDWDYCKCDNCVALAKKNSPTGADTGNRSGNFIIFANKVEKAINEWVKTLDPDKVITFKIFAYFHNQAAPVKKTEDGNYEAVNEEVIPSENIMVFYAPLNNDFSYSWGDPRNTAISDMLKQWQAVTNNIVCYSYGVNYGTDSLYPMNDLLTMGGSYANAAENSYFGYLEESNTYFRYACMQRLKNYISSQMWWNANRASVDEIAYEFIDFYYAPVAEEFKEYYRTLKQWQAYQIDVLGLRVTIMSANYGNSEYWPYEVLNTFMTKIDAMIEKLEKLGAKNPDIYDKYFDRINIEKWWVTFIMCDSYKKYFTDTQFAEMAAMISSYGPQYQVMSQALYEKVQAWGN